MSVCISHFSALEFLRSAGKTIAAETLRQQAATHAPQALSSLGLSGVYLDDLRRWGIEEQPVHMIVSAPNFRSKSRAIRSHVLRGPYPLDSFIRIEQDLYVCSPELLFVVMGQYLSVVELAELGLELCGRYSLRPRNDNAPESWGMSERNPLSTKDRLARFVQRSKSIRGQKAAAQALPYVLDESASPMESKLVLACTLPFARGGYRLPHPQLNYRIESPERSFYLDVYWPDGKIGLEYDSRQFHSDPDKAARDSRRRNALGDLGIQVISITPPELYNPRLFDGIARRVAAALGKRTRARIDDFPERRNNLWKTLFNVCN